MEVVMKLGMIIYSNDPETVFNAFRIGVFSLGKNEAVQVFLLAKGVESETLDNGQFKITELMQEFVDQGGKIFACGTCLKIRQSKSSNFCAMSTLDDLHTIIKYSDKVLTF